MPRWFTYMLECADGSFYAGSTTDLERRLAEHQAGHGCRYTRSRRPVRAAWSQGCRDRSIAQRREAQIKTMTRTDKIDLAQSGRRLR